MLYFYGLVDGVKTLRKVESGENALELVGNQKKISKDLKELGVDPIGAVLTLV